MPSDSSSSSVTSRVCLYGFLVLVACLTSCSIICFGLAIIDDSFVYAGIVCLICVVLLITVHSIYRQRCSARARRRRRGPAAAAAQQGAPAARDRDRAGSRSPPPTDLRTIERDAAALLADVNRAQATALCSVEDLVRLRDDVEAESGRLALWIEGHKVPERSEVQDLVERLDDIRIRLQSILRRSDSITTTALQVQSPTVSTLHHGDHFLFPPPYEDSQRHLPNDRHPTASFALSTSGLPSYSSSSSSSQLTPSSAPPVDDYAPPPYEEATGAPH